MTDEHDPKAEEHVEDLDVPESESEEVKGGLLLPAVDQVTRKDSPQYKLDVNFKPSSFGTL